MRRFLTSHNIRLNERPVRRHNKTGIVERKNLSVKRILQRLQLYKSSSVDATIIARATFFSNAFSGSKTLSSFELALGYTPSILGLPFAVVSPEIMDAYKDQSSTHALQRLISSCTPSTIPP